MTVTSVNVDDITLGPEYDGLDVSVVGGYVRDTVLGMVRHDFVSNKPSDIDLVVTGVLPEELKERGFHHIMSNDKRKPVFKDSDGREVAIARSEKSTGDNHDDFKMDIISPDIPHNKALRKDLERRDLTINAMAVDVRVDGERVNKLYDPFNGRKDLEEGVIRHVSGAFKEDPLRIIRAARYASRYNFEIADETLEIMSNISSLVSSLPDDRLGLELTKMLSKTKSPRMFFDILLGVGALTKSYPEIAALNRVPAGPEKYHKEGSAYEHTMRVLTSMFVQRGNDVNGLLAALFHDVGKAATNPEKYPHHYKHSKLGEKMAPSIYNRYEFVREKRGIIRDSSRIHMQLNNFDDMNTTTVLKYAKLIHESNLSVEQMLALGLADSEGREPKGEFDKKLMRKYLETAISVIEDIGGSEALSSRDISPEQINKEIPGERVGNLIRQDRAEELRDRL